MRPALFLLLTGCANITAIEDGTTFGDLVTVQDWFTSVYVLPTTDGVMLFDAGFRASRIESGLADLGLSPEDVTDVFLTHGHTDHLGALTLFPSALVHASAEEVELVMEETPGPEVTDTLADGDIFLAGDHTIEVLGMTGHTHGSLAYLVDGALLLGDAALIQRNGTLAPVAERRSEDPEAAIEALVALADRLEPRADEIAHLVPSHSGPAEGLQPLLDFRDAQAP
jgi:glyoxylase-like metal-dependent hydrolase (beta-lactamase superfamily II)